MTGPRDRQQPRTRRLSFCLIALLMGSLACSEHGTNDRASQPAKITSAGGATVKLLSLYIPADTVGADAPLRAWVRVTNVGNRTAKEIPVQLRAVSTEPSHIIDVPLDQGVAFDVAPEEERKLEMSSLPRWRLQVGIRPGSYLVYALIPDDRSVEPKTVDTTVARKQVVFQ